MPSKKKRGSKVIQLTVSDLLAIRTWAAQSQLPGHVALLLQMHKARLQKGDQIQSWKEERFVIALSRPELPFFPLEHLRQEAKERGQTLLNCTTQLIHKTFGDPPIKPFDAPQALWDQYSTMPLSRKWPEPTWDVFYKALKERGLT